MINNIKTVSNSSSNSLSRRLAQEKELCRLSKDLLRTLPSSNKALSKELAIQYKALKETENYFKLDSNHWNERDETDAEQLEQFNLRNFLYDQVYPIKEANVKLETKLKEQISLSDRIKCFENLRRNKQKLIFLKELLSDNISNLITDVSHLPYSNDQSTTTVSLRILGCDKISRSFSLKSIKTGLPSIIKRSIKECDTFDTGENINATVRCDLLIAGKVILSTVAREPSSHCWNTTFTYKHDMNNPLEIQVIWMAPYQQLSNIIKRHGPHYEPLNFILSGLVYIPFHEQLDRKFTFRTVNLHPEGRVFLETQLKSTPKSATLKKDCNNTLPKHSKLTNSLPKRPLSISTMSPLPGYNLIALLGTGHFAKIILCQKLTDRRYYAVKIIKKQSVIDGNEYEQIFTEKTVLEVIKSHNHPLMVHLMTCIQDSGHIMFVLEFVQAGDLITLIDDMETFSHEQALFYIASVVLCLEFLHQNNIMYRDLKMENLLLDSRGYIKLVDFGLCKLNIPKDGYTRTLCGTIDYMAPEVYSGKGYTRMVDWWTMGVLLFYMLVGEVPFQGDTESQSVYAILHQSVSIPKSVDAITSSFILSLLNREPKSRLGSRNGAVEVKNHPYFAKIDFDRIVRRKWPAPFIPKLHHDLDLKYFDRQFTSQKPTLSVSDVNLKDNPEAKRFFEEFV